MGSEGDGDRTEENNHSDRLESRQDSERRENEQYDFEAGQETFYKSEPVQSKYATSTRDTKKSDKKKGKESAKRGGLVEVVNRLTKEARKSGIDETEYLSAHLHENLSDYLEEGDNSDEGPWGGAVAIITNGREFLIEENPSTYSVKEARGKLRLIGGQKEAYDSSTRTTLERELREEIKETGEKFEESAKNILLRYSRGSEKYDTITNVINGRLVETDIFKILVPYKDWEIARKAQSTHDAGPFHVLTYDQIWSRPDSDFAFDHGPVIKRFILEEIVKKNSNNSFYTSNYNMPIISTHYNHLKTISSFNNPYTSMNRFN